MALGSTRLGSGCAWLRGGYLARFIALLVVASAITWIRPWAAVAGTLQVCPSGCTFTTIQSAIDAAQTGDTIMIASGTYDETLLVFAPVAAQVLTLIGTGKPGPIVDGQQQGCVLEIDTDYTVTVTGMTFTNGKGIPAGGICNHGTMTLIKVTVSHNEGDESAGGIANDENSTLTLIKSTVNDNTSPSPSGQGGGIFNLGSVSLTKTTVSGNSAPVQGGGIENRGQLHLIDSRIANNTTQGLGGGIESHPGGVGTPTVTLSKSSVIHNTAFTGGGIFNGGVLTVTDTAISNNAAGEGGGMENTFNGTATLKKSRINRNTAGTDGGGIFNDRGTLSLTDSPVNDNHATSNSGAKGGGLEVFGGSAVLNHSPVTHNTASGPIGGLGGGIVVSNAGDLTLTHSPVTGNRASTDGGGIFVFTGTVSLQKSPVKGNQPDNCVNVPGC